METDILARLKRIILQDLFGRDEVEAKQVGVLLWVWKQENNALQLFM
jgi:hypothetical protein